MEPYNQLQPILCFLIIKDDADFNVLEGEMTR